MAPFGVVLLDGASAFEPVDVSPVTYVQSLAARITAALQQHDDIPVADAVATAIAATTAELHLTPRASPSSTVAVLRVRRDIVDLYVLGDSPIVYGTTRRGGGSTAHHLSDDRLARVAVPVRDRYRDRLIAGGGYDDEHRATLAELQRAERRARNTEGGYWIAETDPDAAHHGVVEQVERAAMEWAVVASDGAADLITHTGRDWQDIAWSDERQLDALLAEFHRWEAEDDPDGRVLPRAKRHDDKTLVAIAQVAGLA
ncbi:hypothetical protein PSU4_40070 [Pseudonocardia sulfidoxydans NBRC 16205]|uniref:PPM-type phosphatase domain-containing protein n=1 Tax=Pseudonocardia sulfidoxydans NBRC 16205 TaxID=1223511 RepID=A0A511DLA7_9PSEU|nr:hypothetical protein [Pseudonocardia sulfidoxydans]GEL25053.1 hypothetical protein PSU4_40070 [Pseudonocardia sulfidoxydans NBRC 16205]